MIFNKTGTLEHPQITFIMLFGFVNGYCVGTVVEAHREEELWRVVMKQGCDPKVYPLLQKINLLCPWGGVTES